MVAACELAVKRGLLPREDASRVRNVLERLGLPVHRRGLKPAGLWRIMLHDKKNRGGKVRMVLPKGMGRVTIIDGIVKEEILLCGAEH